MVKFARGVWVPDFFDGIRCRILCLRYFQRSQPYSFCRLLYKYFIPPRPLNLNPKIDPRMEASALWVEFGGSQVTCLQLRACTYNAFCKLPYMTRGSITDNNNNNNTNTNSNSNNNNNEQTTNNKQQTTNNKQQTTTATTTTDNRQQTPNTKHQTINNKQKSNKQTNKQQQQQQQQQQTTNNKQQTTNNTQQTPNTKQ